MLETLKPQRVFKHFEDICSIPHGSGNTDAISSYCIDFAKGLGLRCERDGSNNVLIRKPASKGYEEHPTVVLQGHLDMVCEKTADCDIDFKKDGLKLRLDGDMLSADKTTLGADDGIAVAMIMAVLEDDTLCHPPIEALFTTDEETGMYGAEDFDVKKLKGSTFINLDSGEEGVLTVGCAGGAKVDINIPVTYVQNTLPCKKIAISGLLGGHSGIDINKGRQNADMLLGTLLAGMPVDFKLVSISGGFKDNVIPNASECVVACAGDIGKYVDEFAAANTMHTDSGLKITVTDAASDRRLDRASTERVVRFINSVRSGVTAMSNKINGLVQSSQNLGILATESDHIKAVLSVRSSVAADKQKLLDRLSKAAENVGAEISTRGHYPAWEYREKSRLREIMVSVYKEMYGKEPSVEMVHAGLECGLFCGKIPDFDAVSTGPDMWDIHTVGERLSVSSVERTYNYLLAVLKNL